MKAENAAQAVRTPEATAFLEKMYGTGKAQANAARYELVAQGFAKTFGNRDFDFFSSPGRTEIGGNHTDHNHGKVLAGSIQMDCVAAAAPNGTNVVNLVSETYKQSFSIDLNNLAPTSVTAGTLPLVKGVLAAIQNKGFRLEGFDAYITSNVLGGAGVSSSASFEMLICCIVDYLFNDHTMGVVNYAKAGQYAENKYWLKGSGLLDQLACAVGGIITIDFVDNDNPAIRKVDCDFSDFGMDLVIVNTGKGHSDLSAEYSSVPNEMKAVAGFFGKEVLAELTEEEVIAQAPAVRNACGDRSFLRALHFFEENKRVDAQVAALEAGNKEDFLKKITESGNSSWKWLQNCFLTSTPSEQHITSALALSELFLDKLGDGACRVHGGGFAGVIAVFLPKESTREFCDYINKALGSESAYVMYIRNQGAVKVCF
ncbi:MAG: galactokinase family protein [Eubacteriales bacterium]|nr:galactokinase family protein [Eubacteriales bacterium]